jgi:hypothetical protein
MGRTAPRPPLVKVRRAAQMPVGVCPRPWQPSPPCPQQQQPEPPRHPVDLQVQFSLASQVELLRSELQGCLTRVVSFLVQAEAALGRLLVMPDVSSSSELHIDSVDKGKADLYGCFSPRGGLNTSSLSVASRSEAADVVAPVLQFMPELQELCGVSSVIHPMELVSLEALEVATTPSPSPPPSEPC